MSKHELVAFVLSGGGSLGAIQVGMLRALYERGIVPDLVVGSSAGAVNAAFIASRPQTVQTADDLGRVWRALGRGQVFPLKLLTGLLGFLGSRDHLVPDSGLRSLITRHIERKRLEDMPLPLHLVAVDVITGEELRLSTGSAVDAVMASAAIPALFPPVRWNDRVLMDGAVANDTPISHAVELGAREVYALPTGHGCALEEPPHGALAMALHALSLLTHRRLIDDVDKHKDHTKLVVLPPPCPLAIAPIDFDHADILIDRAHADACEFLDGGGAMRPPLRMRIHRHDTHRWTKEEVTVTTRERRPSTAVTPPRASSIHVHTLDVVKTIGSYPTTTQITMRTVPMCKVSS
jgi:NTE family protein